MFLLSKKKFFYCDIVISLWKNMLNIEISMEESVEMNWKFN